MSSLTFRKGKSDKLVHLSIDWGRITDIPGGRKEFEDTVNAFYAFLLKAREQGVLDELSKVKDVKGFFNTYLNMVGKK